MLNFNSYFAAAVKLISRIAIYVPSTVDVDTPVDPAQEVEKTARFLSELFGGATAQPATGYWVSNAGKLIEEPVTVVYANATPEDIDQHAGEIFQLAEEIKRDMKQEAVSIERDGELYLV